MCVCIVQKKIGINAHFFVIEINKYDGSRKREIKNCYEYENRSFYSMI